MRGKRCRALRKEFYDTFGRFPQRTTVMQRTMEPGGGATLRYMISTWRRLKRIYARAKAENRHWLDYARDL